MTDAIKCIVVDDEQYAIDIVTNYIERTDGMELLARCSNAYELMEKIESEQADLIFLDIQMPQVDGIQVIEFFGANGPLIIFTTAYQEYAVQAFELNVVDYLLKPFSYDRFGQAIKKVKTMLQRSPASKYMRSGLTEIKSAQLFYEATEYLQKSKAYLNPGLRLDELAKQMNVNRNHLSQAINTASRQTFWNFLNQFRVEETKARLTSTKYKHLSIEGIALDSGFNSISAFNTIFKKMTGITPSQFKGRADNHH